MSRVDSCDGLFTSFILDGFMKFRRSQGIVENYADGNIRERIPKDPADLILDAIGYLPQLVQYHGKKLKGNF